MTVLVAALPLALVTVCEKPSRRLWLAAPVKVRLVVVPATWRVLLGSALPTYWPQLLGTVDALNKERALPLC